MENMEYLKKYIDVLYFVDVLGNTVIVNDRYQGILLLNYDFEIIKKIYLDNEIVIDKILSKDDKLVLISYEMQMIYTVDLKPIKVNKFNIKQFGNIFFSNIYEWTENIIYLATIDGERYFKLDLVKNNLMEEMKDEHSKELLSAINKVAEMDVYASNSLKKQILTQNGGKYSICNYSEKTEKNMNIDIISDSNSLASERVCYLTEFTQNHVIRIAEQFVQILSKDKTYNIYPPEETYRFIGGRVVEKNEEDILFLIAGDNRDEKESMILKYSLQ